MKEKNGKECPWCGEPLVFEENYYQGPYSKIRVLRCSKCYKLISARMDGEPNKIIKKELIEGSSM
jgi:C4-type Zn-finger protein